MDCWVNAARKATRGSRCKRKGFSVAWFGVNGVWRGWDESVGRRGLVYGCRFGDGMVREKVEG